MRFWIYIALIGIFCSCEKQLSIPLDKFDQKLVVNAFATNTAAMEVNLSTNTPLLENPSYSSGISKARIILFEDDYLISDKKLSLSQGHVKTSNFMQLGKKYEIIIEVDGFPVVNAIDSMPNSLPGYELNTIKTLADNMHLNVTLNDDLGDDQYMILLYIRGREVIDGDTFWTEKPLNFNSADKLFISNINTIRANSHFAFYDDKLIQGSSKTLDLVFDKKNAIATSIFIPKYVRVELRSLSEQYFEYNLKLLENNHIYGGPLSSSSYFEGNVSGGLGVFACYATETKLISLP